MSMITSRGVPRNTETPSMRGIKGVRLPGQLATKSTSGLKGQVKLPMPFRIDYLGVTYPDVMGMGTTCLALGTVHIFKTQPM